MHNIGGVHHVGIGVRNMEIMKNFYRDVLGFSSVFGVLPEEDHMPIHALTRTSRAVHSATLMNQEIGGVSVSLFHMVDPVPRPIRRDFRYGDIGVAKITLAVSDVDKFYEELKSTLSFCSIPGVVELPGWGNYHFFYCKDPEGNLIEFISGKQVPEGKRFGGACWAGVGVTDLERSKEFYRERLGFDKVEINDHEKFSGLVDELSGGRRTKVRSCVLASNKEGGMLELFEALEPRGRSIPFSTRWGDFGYLQVCMRCDDVDETAAHFEKEGMDFLTPPQRIDDFQQEDAGGFFYIQDPDGIPVEFFSMP
jgi:catechol 2,3-dioxygenase-like lactoylglutathione lyase family enzyme